jgi:hypothetical protein
MSILRRCIKCQEQFYKESFARRFNGERTSRCIKCLKEDGCDICPHNLIKLYCRNCSEFCEHERDITTCKLCCDPIPIIVKNMVHWNLQNDKKKGIYDADNCVDEDHVLELIWIAQGNCYYCKCSLQYVIKTDNLASLERLTNKLGHVKGNCVIACLKCNRAGVGEKIERRPTKKRIPNIREVISKMSKEISLEKKNSVESNSTKPAPEFRGKKRTSELPSDSAEPAPQKKRRSRMDEIEIVL